jgi:hypothetical protein
MRGMPLQARRALRINGLHQRLGRRKQLQTTEVYGECAHLGVRQRLTRRVLDAHAQFGRL